MLGSLQMDASIPKLKSKQVLSSSEEPKSLKLEVLDASKLPRRSSFLPDNWDDQPKTTKASRYDAISTMSIRVPEKRRRAKKFCTGSAYYGQFNQLGMAGRGVYRFPHGVIYDGFFNSRGEFHGTGILVYPGGQRVEGLWRNGKLIKGGATFISGDNAPSSRFYCKMPDRRFQIEVDDEMKPAGGEYLTNSAVPRQIPPGMYDTGEGFYDPVRRVIVDYYDMDTEKTAFEPFSEDSKYAFSMVLKMSSSEHKMAQVMRHQPASFRDTRIECIPSEEKEQWIINNCRKAWDEPTGFRTDLYEIWTPGFKKHNLERIEILDRLRTPEMDILIDRLSQVAQEKSSNVYSFIQNVSRRGTQRNGPGTPRSIPSTPDRYPSRGRKSRRWKPVPSPQVTSSGLKPFMFLFEESKPTTTHVRIKDDHVEVI